MNQIPQRCDKCGGAIYETTGSGVYRRFLCLNTNRHEMWVERAPQRQEVPPLRIPVQGVKKTVV